MQRKIIPDAENRLLILYAIKTIGPLSDQQLLEVMTETDLMNYITLQLTLADLEADGSLRHADHPMAPMLTLTDAGRYLLDSFEAHIPSSRRKLLDDGLPRWRDRFLAQQTAIAEPFALPGGEKGLHLQLIDRRNIVLDITFTLPAGRTVNRISERWQQCMNQVYLLLISTLASGHDDFADAPPLPQGCSVTPVSDVEWMMTACDDPTAPQITLMMSLPGEKMAQCCAAAFPGLSSAVREAILSLLDNALEK